MTIGFFTENIKILYEVEDNKPVFVGADVSNFIDGTKKSITSYWDSCKTYYKCDIGENGKVIGEFLEWHEDGNILYRAEYDENGTKGRDEIHERGDTNFIEPDSRIELLDYFERCKNLIPEEILTENNSCRIGYIIIDENGNVEVK